MSENIKCSCYRLFNHELNEYPCDACQPEIKNSYVNKNIKYLEDKVAELTKENHKLRYLVKELRKTI